MYYSIRLLYNVFLDDFNGFKVVILNHAKSTNIEFIVLGFLGILSITTGYYFKDVFLGTGTNYFNNAILILPMTWSFIDLEFIPVLIKLMPVFTSILSFVVAVMLNSQQQSESVVKLTQSKTYFEVCK